MPESAMRPSKPSQMHDTHLAESCIPNPEVRDLAPSGSARRRKLLKRGLLVGMPLLWPAATSSSTRSGSKTAARNAAIVLLPNRATSSAATPSIWWLSRSSALVLIVIILLRSNLSLYQQEAIGIGAAILLPIIFFPWSRTIWMALDLTVQGDSHLEQEQRRSAAQRPSPEP